MDNEKLIEHIKDLLAIGYNKSHEESILILEQSLYQVKKEKAEEDEAVKVIEEEKKRKEELRTTNKGYKYVRFKKPLPPLEDRKTYIRVCRRCDTEYRTFSKYSFFCDKCKRNSFANEVPKDLNNKSYKTG